CAATAATELARVLGSSITTARHRLQTGRRLDEVPELAASAGAGELSPSQLLALGDAVTADPASTRELVELARERSLAELEDECRRRRAAAAGKDGEARRARIHARRSLRHYTDSEGVAHLHWLDNPERVAELMAGIAPARERLFARARKAGEPVRAEALDADALLATVRAANQSPTDSNSLDASYQRPAGRARILVRVDFDTLLRGYPIKGETAEIAGYGPVTVSAIADLIATGNPLLVALATRGQRVTGVVSVRRRPTAAQAAALDWMQPVCAVTGCNQTARLQTDHNRDWAQTKVTLLEWLDRLCPTHHRLKTTANWGLVAGQGKRAFVPPTDPRHPSRTTGTRPAIAAQARAPA
ncbi:MAG: hypothetical protein ACYCO3_05630, partial [Mycobacteriales bacterium]